MTQAVDVAEDALSEPEIRDALVDKLLADGMITSPAVEAAFRAVPRAKFIPAGTPLDVVYNADDSVTTKTDEHGVIISSISAPFIQAQMIEQAEIAPGMSVLEIGSGGYNAALLAEIVGSDGVVVSMDIDKDVTDRASAALAETGYGDRVTVIQGDAEHGVPDIPRFDRIIVTVGAWDIPPAWLNQLAEDGRLVLPLRMNGITRTIAFRRDADRLVSTSAQVAGFVAMQGDGAHSEKVYLLPDGHGRSIKLRFDDGPLENPELLDGVLGTERTAVWSGVTIKHRTSFADLHLWFASYLVGFCKLAIDQGIAMAEEGGGWFPFGVVRGDSFAYLATRSALDGAGVEFGALAYGFHAEEAGTALIEQVQAWDRLARGGPAPTFAVWPIDTDRVRLPEGSAVIAKEHSLITISWPAAG
jgi:protein-L-isoaspartate(D-aspartate) O-methyltransferase